MALRPLLALLIGTALGRSFHQIKAAELDGAGTWAIFRYIKLPAIRNMLLVGTVLQVILSLQVFDIIFTLTRGGPGLDTTVMYYFIYNTAFGTLNFGYSAALSVCSSHSSSCFPLHWSICGSAPGTGRRQAGAAAVDDDRRPALSLRMLATGFPTVLPSDEEFGNLPYDDGSACVASSCPAG